MQRLQTLLKKAYIAFQKSVYAGTAAAGCFLVYHGYLLSQLKQILPDNEQAEREITVGEEKPKLSFEDYCRLNPISTCWDNSEATDFCIRTTNISRLWNRSRLTLSFWKKH